MPGRQAAARTDDPVPTEFSASKIGSQKPVHVQRAIARKNSAIERSGSSDLLREGRHQPVEFGGESERNSCGQLRAVPAMRHCEHLAFVVRP